ncbi:hypothetical protein WJX84_009559 [Apatococcus fuscideae]|uniref:Ion transport domain-containing protein n=1 Tax=Apatococcus fuscideae TaxID=2026836 RepID=A0AAW1SVI7_9CHLO
MSDQPLLHGREDSSLASAEQGGSGSVSIAELMARPTDKIQEHLAESGVRHLGYVTSKAGYVDDLFDDDGMRTAGASSAEVDHSNMWQKKLKTSSRAHEQTRDVELEASVITLKHAANADDAGLINPLLKKVQQHLLPEKVFTIPAVKAVILYKWTSWAQQLLWLEVAFYALWLFGFQAFVLLFQDEDTKRSLPELLATTRGIGTVVAEAAALFGMAPFLWIEACTLKEYGVFGWASIWNVMDVAMYINQVAIAVMHLGRFNVSSDLLSVLMAFQVLLLWINKVQYFSRVLQPAKNPFIDTLTVVIEDVKWFLFLLVLTLWGFACAFYILFRHDQQHEEFRTIGAAVLTTVTMLLGGVDFKLIHQSHNPNVATVLLVAYVFSMCIVLLNCLIAIMSESANKRVAARWFSTCDLLLRIILSPKA